MTRLAAFAQLVRAPAALTVPGDTLAGSAAAGLAMRGRRLALPLASACLYWAGMALNDWSDRELDAVERPERPIPSGRVGPHEALAVAGGLTGAGLALAALGGGRSAVRVAVPLAAAVWAYDLVLKSGPLGPAGMALCRGLDVLLGATGSASPASASSRCASSGSASSRSASSGFGRSRSASPGFGSSRSASCRGAGGVRAALPAAAALAVHTAGVTALARGEVHGTAGNTAMAAVGGTALVGLATAVGPAVSWRHRLLGGLGAAAYGVFVGRAQAEASRDPSAGTVRGATVAGIHGMVPLQAALAARAGAPVAAAGLLAALPAARALSRRVSPT